MMGPWFARRDDVALVRTEGGPGGIVSVDSDDDRAGHAARAPLPVSWAISIGRPSAEDSVTPDPQSNAGATRPDATRPAGEPPPLPDAGAPAAPTRAGSNPLRGPAAVVAGYLERLRAAVVRSPLLNASPGKTGGGSRLDLTDLNFFREGDAQRLLDRLMAQRVSVTIAPDWSRLDGAETGENDPDVLIPRLIRQVERHFVREVAKFERETGIHSLWLGYPIAAVTSPADPERAILAPVFLWPVRATLDRGRQWTFSLERDRDDEGPVFNRMLASWLERLVNVRPAVPGEGNAPAELPRSRAQVRECVARIFAGFENLTLEDFESPLRPIPDLPSVRSRPQFTVLNGAVLGIMRWQNQAIMDDLETLVSLEEVEHQPAAALLSGESVKPAGGSERFASEDDRHLVTAADYSQEAAILRARTETGLIIHGPPGTGKSQTITNIVADALARKQRVLVVCQKRAAIDVVANRLRKAGLADLFAVVHDVAGDRMRLLEQLQDRVDALSQARSSEPRTDGPIANPERDKLCRQIEELEGRLDALHADLHRRRDFGLSFAELTAKLIRLTRAGEKPDEDRAIGQTLETLNAEELAGLLGRLDPIARLFAASDPANNPWSRRRDHFDLTPFVADEVRQAIAKIRAAWAAYDALGTRLQVEAPLEVVRAWHAALLEAAERLLTNPDLAAVRALHLWRVEKGHDASRLGKTRELLQSMSAIKLDPSLSSLVPELPPAESGRLTGLLKIVLKRRGDWFAWLSGEHRTAKGAVAAIIRPWGLAFSWEAAEGLANLLHWRSQRDGVTAGLIALSPQGHWDPPSAPEAFHAAANDALTRLEKLDAALDGFLAPTRPLKPAAKAREAQAALAHGTSDDPGMGLRTLIESLRLAIRACDALAPVLQTIAGLDHFLQPQSVQEITDLARRGVEIDPPLERLLQWLPTLDALHRHDALMLALRPAERGIAQRLAQANIGGAAAGSPQEAPASNDTPAQERSAARWAAAVEFSVLMAWRRRAIQASPGLDAWDDQAIAGLKEQLARALEQKREREAAAIVQSWTRDQMAVLKDKVGEFRRLLPRTGPNAKRLREVLHRGQALGLFDLAPCWLTNPEAACQMMPLSPGLFDLVIFDEASQLPLEQATPIVYRGKRVVVSGDEHQLPPTAFFQSSVGDDDDTPLDEDALAGAADGAGAAAAVEGLRLAAGASDLLDLSRHLLPSHLLNVHYRSRHPALIQFSNRAFYKGRLEAAHPVWGTPSQERSPIQIHRVDGLYDGRCNREEARYVVDLLAHLWSVAGDPPTVGVVTFNQQQEELIEQELHLRAQTDHAFAARLEEQQSRRAGQEDVGFFVKNLESVQGDERDLIIFSTTFGKATDGVFRRSFGPLTANGGERRLNVAVSRSKVGMVIVTSMPFAQVGDVFGGLQPAQQAKAKDFLQAYLFYAQSVNEAEPSRIDTWLERAGQLGGAAARAGEGAKRNRGGVAGCESPFEEAVYEGLRRRGWEVDTQVGEGGFRVDLAVRHKDPARGYLLGIECDGATYHDSWSARNRDVWREDILRQYGWKLLRVWSTRFWRNPEAVLDDLHARLERAVSDADQAGAAAPAVPRMLDASQRSAASRPAPAEPAGPADPASRLTDILDAAELAKWAAALQGALRDPAWKGELAAWSAAEGRRYALAIAQSRRQRSLRITDGETIAESCDLPATIDEPAAKALATELESCRTHLDVIDWLRRAKLRLHPQREQADARG